MTASTANIVQRKEPPVSRSSGALWLLYFSTRRLPLVSAALVFAVIAAQVWLVWSDLGLNDEMVLSSAFIGGALLAYPVAAGVGAWIGYRESRLALSSVYDTSTHRVHLARIATVCGPTITIVAGVIIAGLATSISMTILPHRVGMVGAGVVVSTALMVAVWVPIGYLVARRIGHALAVPAVALLGWLLPSLLGTGQGTPSAMFLPAAAPGGDVFPTWNGPVLWWQTGWFGGLILILLAVVMWRPNSRLTVGVLAVGLIAAAGSASAIAHLDFDRHRTIVQNGLPVAQAVCADEDPQLCLHPAFESMRAELHGSFASLMNKVRDTPAYATSLEHRPRGIGQQPAGEVKAFHLDYALPTDSVFARQEYVEGLLDWDACYVDHDPASEPWNTVVYQWLVEDLDNPSRDSDFEPTVDADQRREVRESFMSLTPDARNEWFASHYEQFQRCALTASDFAH